MSSEQPLNSSSLNHDTVVLIPSSRYIDAEMQLDLGKIPAALIPLHGRTALELIVEKFKSKIKDPRFIVLANEGAELIRAKVSQSPSLEGLQVIDVPLVASLGEVIEFGLKQIKFSDSTQLFINFADTIVEAQYDQNDNAVYFDTLRESFRWTTFQVNNGKISSLADKWERDDVEACKVFTGVFFIREPKRFLTALGSASEDSALGTFYQGLELYLKTSSYNLVPTKEWYDLGHIDNYYSAKKHFVNTRFFNRVQIDETRSVVTKSSSNTAKFIDEIRWYLELPSGLKCYTPQVYDFSLSGSKSFVKLEYYGYPTVADLYIHAGYQLSIWNHVLERIFGVIAEMRQYSLHADSEAIDAALRQMYIEKTISRLEALKADPFWKELMDRQVSINGNQYEPLSFYLDRLQSIAQRILIKDTTSLSVIHGDLCLANILYDPKNRIIKLIDPRGKFGDFSVYGDYRYDLAKLYHSFIGHYESIISNDFFLLKDDTNISYSLNLSDYQNKITELFLRRLKKDFSSDIYAIQFIEALLFLSMVPLHTDFLNRQLLMYSIGLEKLASFVNAEV